jgi:hypothetical protein
MGYDDEFDEHGLLKDGRTFKVPQRMLDSMQRRVARHFQRADDTRPHVVDGTGSKILNRPGWRHLAGGHENDQALRDAEHDECQRAYDRYQYDLTNAYRHRDQADDDAEVEARAGAIRHALLSRGHEPGDVERYLSGCEDDDLLDGMIDEQVAAFEQSQNGRDLRTVAVDRRIRLEELYRARDQALSEEWKRSK